MNLHAICGYIDKNNKPKIQKCKIQKKKVICVFIYCKNLTFFLRKFPLMVQS